MAAAAPSGAPAPGSNAASAAPILQAAHDDESSSTSSELKEQTPLDETSVACLIINKMIGTGIYTTPGIILLLCGNKILALILWLCGGIYSYLRLAYSLHANAPLLTCDFSIYIYLEYGLAWPYNGGEFFYVCTSSDRSNRLWTRLMIKDIKNIPSAPPSIRMFVCLGLRLFLHFCGKRAEFCQISTPHEES